MDLLQVIEDFKNRVESIFNHIKNLTNIKNDGRRERDELDEEMRKMDEMEKKLSNRVNKLFDTNDIDKRLKINKISYMRDEIIKRLIHEYFGNDAQEFIRTKDMSIFKRVRRKLLAENHPDKVGDDMKFKLINKEMGIIQEYIEKGFL
jgi:hypothetical protein